MSESDRSLVAASYNIASTHYAPDRGEARMNELLVKAGADVAGLQEVDFCNGRHAYDMLGRFSECGSFPYRYYQKAIDFMGGSYGIGILSRLQPVRTSGGPLPGASSGFEGRAYARMVVEKAGRQIAVYNTHLSYEDRELKKQQMLFLANLVARDPVPYKIITGDFNTDAAREEFLPLANTMNLANGADGVWYDTFNRENPNGALCCIDNIAFTSNLRLCGVSMIPSMLSDHNPLIAEFELLDQPLAPEACPKFLP